MKKPRRVVAVDLDGTLADDTGPFDRELVGPPLPGARVFMKRLREELDCEILIYTVRCSVEFHGRSWANAGRRVVEDWLHIHDIPYDRIWMEEGKPHASAFVDDRGVPCAAVGNPEAYLGALARIRKLVAE